MCRRRGQGCGFGVENTLCSSARAGTCRLPSGDTAAKDWKSSLRWTQGPLHVLAFACLSRLFYTTFSPKHSHHNPWVPRRSSPSSFPPFARGTGSVFPWKPALPQWAWFCLLAPAESWAFTTAPIAWSIIIVSVSHSLACRHDAVCPHKSAR